MEASGEADDDIVSLQPPKSAAVIINIVKAKSGVFLSGKGAFCGSKFIFMTFLQQFG
ncbi:hypothetical protein D3C86_1907550 [compost metagenome]